MRANHSSDDYRDPEKTHPPKWAGLPIEYWIDLNALEESPLFEILQDLCGKFPEQSREQHIELIARRLTERGGRDEIAFYFVSGERTTDLTVSDALARLHLPGTWKVNWDEHLVVWKKPVTPVRRFLRMCSGLAGALGHLFSSKNHRS
jgi:hypothetical protein